MTYLLSGSFEFRIKGIAQAIIDRHKLLTEFLRLFNIDEDTIYRDVEGMEHHVSRATLAALRAVTQTLRESPDFRKKVLNRLAGS